MLHCTYCGYYPEEEFESLTTVVVDGEVGYTCDVCLTLTELEEKTYEEFRDTCIVCGCDIAEENCETEKEFDVRAFNIIVAYTCPNDRCPSRGKRINKHVH